MRLPFLHRKPEPERARTPPPRSEGARGAAADFGAADVAAARARARRRLVGASVLVLIGILGFPLLFETQPRPLPMDIPIDVAQRASGTVANARLAAPVPIQPAAVAPPPADPGAEAGASTPPPAAAPSSPPPAREALAEPPPMAATESPPAKASPAPPATTTPSAPRPTTAGTTAAVADAPRLADAAPQTQDGARAAALLGGASAVPAAAKRFVVQVGAYADAATLREARAKVEQLGLKTYTQVIDNDARKRTRVRLGPFATQEEAQAAAAKVKRAGLPANVLTL